jgi:hypothetical protein
MRALLTRKAFGQAWATATMERMADPTMLPVMDSGVMWIK